MMNQESKKFKKHKPSAIWDDTFNYLERGLEYKVNGDTNNAIKSFLQALQLDIAFTPALIELAILYDDIDELDKSIDYYQRAVQLDPYHYELRLHFANALIRLEKIEDGIEQIRQAIEIDESNHDAWYYLAVTYFFYLNETEKAHSIIEVILQQEPDYVSAYTLLGEIKFSEGNLSEATQNFEYALTIDPENKDAHLALSAIYGNDLKNRQKSLKHSLFLLEKDPNDTLAQHNAQMALQLPPSQNQSISESALEESMAYLYMEKWDLAEHAIKRAMKINPTQPRLWQRLQEIKNKRKA